MGDDRFRIELLRLLLQVTWADGTVEPAEARALLTRARTWGVPGAELAMLTERLRERDPLPAPNLGLLRGRKQEVLAEVHALAGADGVIGADESEMIEQIEALLG